MKNMFRFGKMAIVFAITTTVLAFNIQPGNLSEWQVPDKYRNKENLVKQNDSTLAIGKMLYKKHCYSCHGERGKADGPKSFQLDYLPPQFIEESFRHQTDGEIFFKISEGRGEMGSYKKKIAKNEDRWMLVNYVRSFESK